LYYSTGQALSPLRARGPSGLAARGEGRPFIPPAKLGGILAHFDKFVLRLSPPAVHWEIVLKGNDDW